MSNPYNSKFRNNQLLTVEKLQQMILGSGRTLDYYLNVSPEKFALVLYDALLVLNRYSEHKIVNIVQKSTSKVLHIGVLHHNDVVDVRGRHKSVVTLCNHLPVKGIKNEDVELIPCIPTQLLEEIQGKESRKQLYYEIQDLQVFIKREWFNNSNFFLR